MDDRLVAFKQFAAHSDSKKFVRVAHTIDDLVFNKSLTASSNITVRRIMNMFRIKQCPSDTFLLWKDGTRIRIRVNHNPNKKEDLCCNLTYHEKDRDNVSFHFNNLSDAFSREYQARLRRFEAQCAATRPYEQ